MLIRNLGKFTRSAVPLNFPREDVLFCANPDGQDWYELQSEIPYGTRLVLIDDSGVVRAEDDDPSRLFPMGFTALVISGDGGSVRGKIWDGAQFNDPPPVPEIITVSAAQGCAALDDDALCVSLGIEPGLYDRCAALAEKHPYKPVRHFWQRANSWESDSLYLNLLATELNISDDQFYALFQAARNY